MNDMMKAVIAYETANHFVTSADTRRELESQEAQLDYQRQRDRENLAYQQERDMQRLNLQRQQIESQERQTEMNLKCQREQAWIEEERHREDMLAAQEMQERQLENDREQHERTVRAWMDNEKSKLAVQRELAKQKAEHTEYLVTKRTEFQREQNFENALDRLNEGILETAFRDFPLAVSPIVLFGDRDTALERLTRKPVTHSDTYSNCRELPVRIFVTPLSFRDNQMAEDWWSEVCHGVELFFVRHYNKVDNNPVDFYANAWKGGRNIGTYAAEAVHFFLGDMPCMVVEPVLTSGGFSIVISSWMLCEPNCAMEHREMCIPMYTAALENKADYAALCCRISQFVALNIAMLADIHFWIARGKPPVLPLLLENEMPDAFADTSVRQAIASFYEYASASSRLAASVIDNLIEDNMVRLVQLIRLKRQLQTIGEKDIDHCILNILKTYARQRYKRTFTGPEPLWDFLTDQVSKDNARFFAALLPFIADKTRYKRIDRRLAKLREEGNK